jgi:hypothetical protein
LPATLVDVDSSISKKITNALEGFIDPVNTLNRFDSHQKTRGPRVYRD